ncbi:DUF4400 domain-containing protein [Pseudomonas luteola]|uniref:DUF4400 domain-containing protein n=2 Tax=Pseudomonas luteola TaxID=47886 RepID=A0ABS0FS29_PSELU|nr:DUF4400 domain-containing protein [Pseudomonas zeshuii]MBF8643146.1 DUF4400 domain-containing protein [Pseudomonas zeshuii]
MKTPLWLTLFLVAIELLLVTVFIPGDWTERVIREESAMVRSHLGEESQAYVNTKAMNWYKGAVFETGVYPALHRLMIPSDEEAARSRGMERMGDFLFSWMEDRLDALMHMVYQICARLALLSIWLPYMALLLIPAIWDGFMRRRVKQTNYDYASPVWNRYGMLSASVAAQAVLIAFISPIAINPAILPIVMMFVCVMMGVFVGNLQKQI